MSDGLARAVGAAAEALRGALLADLVHGPDRGALDAALRGLEQGAPERSLPLRIGPEGGRSRVLLWDLEPVPEGPFVTGCARDVAAEHRELLRFKALVDAAPDYIAITTLPGERVYANHAGMALLGREGQDPREVKLDEIVAPGGAGRHGRHRPRSHCAETERGGGTALPPRGGSCAPDLNPFARGPRARPMIAAGASS